jgi:hypothetical protein
MTEKRRSRRLDWRETHVSTAGAAKHLGVDTAVLRGVIRQGLLQYDPQPDRSGRLLDVLRRSDVEAIKQRMYSLRGDSK